MTAKLRLQTHRCLTCGAAGPTRSQRSDVRIHCDKIGLGIDKGHADDEPASELLRESEQVEDELRLLVATLVANKTDRRDHECATDCPEEGT